VKTKLTVRVDCDLLISARSYAKQHGITLSQLIDEYLRAIVVAHDKPITNTPVLYRLSGILPADTSVEEYQNHLAEKYRKTAP
jgi:hypothetical protein